MRSRAVGHDEREVLVGLDVAPKLRARRVGRLGQVTDEHRVHRIGDVDERGAVVTADEGVLPTGLGIGPSPVVVGAHAPGPVGCPEHRDRHIGVKLDLVAVEEPDGAVLAAPLLADDRVEGVRRAHDPSLLPPAT